MDGLFRYDGPFIKALVKVANMMILSVVWALCCIPVVTLIPATAALYHTTVKVVRKTGNHVLKDFFKALKGNFKQGWLLSVIMAVSGALLAYDIWFGTQMTSTAGLVYLCIGLALSVLWLGLLVFLPPALSRFEGSVGMLLRMSMYLSSANVLRTAYMLILLGLTAFAIYMYPVLLMLLPGMYADIISFGMEKSLKKFMPEEETAAEEETADAAAAPSALELEEQMENMK